MNELDLIRLAQQDKSSGAVDALLSRHLGPIHRFIAKLAQQAGLQRSDAEDAEQEALCAIIEVIDGYDVERFGQPGGCTFRTFICRVLAARFTDHIRRIRRIQVHEETIISADRIPSSAASSGSPALIRAFPPSSWKNDPAAILEWQEQMACLEQAVNELTPTSRCLWERLRSGLQLRAAADDLGISYRAAKRRWLKIKRHIKKRLHIFRE
jgi:RNA polymerase sigma factor (sigma-70 family)